MSDGKEMELVIIFVIIWTEIEDGTIAFDDLCRTQIAIIPSGSVIEVRLEQFSNAEFPMEVTPSGSLIEVSWEQFSNAESLMEEISFDMTSSPDKSSLHVRIRV